MGSIYRLHSAYIFLKSEQLNHKSKIEKRNVILDIFVSDISIARNFPLPGLENFLTKIYHCICFFKMFKLLVLLFIVMLYARNNIFFVSYFKNIRTRYCLFGLDIFVFLEKSLRIRALSRR